MSEDKTANKSSCVLGISSEAPSILE